MNSTATKHILLIDDDPHLRQLVSDSLHFEGYEVTTAAGGLEALHTLKTARPDLILLDIMMPDMDGGEVAQKIRGNPATAEIRIVFLTAAVSEPEVDSHHGNIGGDTFIAKSGDSRILIERIKDVLAE